MTWYPAVGGTMPFGLCALTAGPGGVFGRNLTEAARPRFFRSNGVLFNLKTARASPGDSCSQPRTELHFSLRPMTLSNTGLAGTYHASRSTRPNGHLKRPFS